VYRVSTCVTGEGSSILGEEEGKTTHLVDKRVILRGERAGYKLKPGRKKALMQKERKKNQKFREDKRSNGKNFPKGNVRKNRGKREKKGERWGQRGKKPVILTRKNEVKLASGCQEKWVLEAAACGRGAKKGPRNDFGIIHNRKRKANG